MFRGVAKILRAARGEVAGDMADLRAVRFASALLSAAAFGAGCDARRFLRRGAYFDDSAGRRF